MYSRFIVGYGVFSEATRMHTIDVLHDAISKHGMPALILTDRGSQFYASESECKKKGSSEFEQELVRLGIRYILARVNHPQTNGKLNWFEDIHRFVAWWNHIRPHAFLDWDSLEAPVEVFIRRCHLKEPSW